MNDHPPNQDEDEIDSIARENDPKIKYLIDRAKGTSKLAKSKPPCFLCFVPIPVVWAADLVEQNCVFETLGSFGYYSPTNLKARAVCIGLGLLLNILSTILSGYCLFATSDDFDMIWASAFTSGFIKPGNEEIVPYQLTIRMGLKAIAVKTFHTDLNEYISPKKLCPLINFVTTYNRILSFQTGTLVMIATL